MIAHPVPTVRFVPLEAAKLRRTTVGLALDLEKERGLRVKMQKPEIAWRRITPVQEAQIVEMLRAHPMTVSVPAVAGDPESTLYGVTRGWRFS